MDQAMMVDELRKELRHIKSRRDFFMNEVTKLRKELADIRKMYADMMARRDEGEVDLLNKLKDAHDQLKQLKGADIG